MTASHLALLIVKIIAAATPLCVAAAFFVRRKRRTRARIVLLALITLGWGLAVWGFLIEPNTLSVREVVVESHQWTGPPLRIGVISDTHVASPHVDLARVREVVTRMNGLRPDMVVVLGDYAGSHEPAAKRAPAERAQIIAGVEAFADLRAPLGVAGVLGNHDWWYDGLAIETAMRKARVLALSNVAVRIHRPEGDFYVAGLESLVSQRALPSPSRALRDVPPDLPVIVLMHEPDAFADVPARAALSLAGHTHCGQVRFPLIGGVVYPSPGSARWPCGLYDEGGRQLYVTGGVGTSVLPVRFGAGPQIAIVTLRKPAP